MLLNELLAKGLVEYRTGFPTWEEAVRASYATLLKNGYIEEEYIGEVIESINKFGPYIVIMPLVAIPHTMQGATGALRSGISFMKVETPVSFEPGNEENDARLFFSLAAVDSDQHLRNMKELAEMLMIEGFVDDLLNTTDIESLKIVLRDYS